MPIIDSQVHAYEANTPKRPWHSVPNWPDHVTGDEMVAAMDRVGVDGAIFISAFSMYRYDASYAVEVQRAHPGRLAIVKPVDPDDPAVADVIADWKKTPGTVGIRIILTQESGRGPDDPGLGRLFDAYRKRTGREPRHYFAIGDAPAILERIAAYVDAGVSKFILRPAARGDEEMLAQTRRLIEEVLPLAAARWPKPRRPMAAE